MSVRRQRDDGSLTKWWCKLGLVISWVVGVGAAAGGGICLFLELRDGNAVFFYLEHPWREILPLGLNIIGAFGRRIHCEASSLPPDRGRHSHSHER